MEASVRLFNPSALNRHFSTSILKRNPHFPKHISRVPKSQFCTKLSFLLNPRSTSRRYPNLFLNVSCSSRSLFSATPKDSVFEWYKSGQDGGAAEAGRQMSLNKSDRNATVVLLGWLGAKNKHLKRYAELYASRGINVITFVVPVPDVLWFDLGKRIERRIEILANELSTWVLDNCGINDRNLLFHTFSNTGWLVYGSILNIWKEREDLLLKIKGCIVDSGGDPELNPKVWAAGFAAALLKKSSSSAYVSAAEATEASRLEHNMGATKGPPVIECAVLSALEKLFSYLLYAPNVNQKLSRIISTLADNPPSCPQLYLYSTADKVIPFQSVESFMEDQRGKGRKVWSCNCGSSPHVDHYRTFPDLYSSQLQNFLKECWPSMNQP